MKSKKTVSIALAASIISMSVFTHHSCLISANTPELTPWSRNLNSIIVTPKDTQVSLTGKIIAIKDISRPEKQKLLNRVPAVIQSIANGGSFVVLNYDR